MKKGKGWHNESIRHSLSAKGVKSAQKIKSRILKSAETRFNQPSQKVRPPSLKVMADWVEQNYPDVEVKIKTEGATFKKVDSSGIRLSSRYEQRKTAQIIHKKTGKVLFNYNPLSSVTSLSAFADFISDKKLGLEYELKQINKKVK